MRPPKLKMKQKKTTCLEDEELSVDDILNNKVNKKDAVDNDSTKQNQRKKNFKENIK